MVEYEAGPNGFVARGDVGPDMFPHDQAPETQVPQIARYTQDEDLQLVPRPVQMAGWSPGENPMGQPVTATDTSVLGQDGFGTELNPGQDGYSTSNNTSSGQAETYDPNVQPYDDRYPRISVLANENSRRELEDLTAQTPGDENKSDMIREEYPVTGPVNVNNIDVNPNDIRVAASGNRAPVRRSADGSRYSSSLPYSYRNYRRQTHDHDAETRNQAIGYRVVYRPSHDHYNERYYRRSTHDHDAEKRRYVSNRQTHDHDAEKRYIPYRQTHDHDAERKYVSNRQTHDHDAEKYDNYRSAYYRNTYPYRRRIFYRDSHSDVPHEHYSNVYRNENDRYHQHSDVQLYGRTQNLEYPATAKPRQLKYIPSDRYHDKYYYWTD